MPFSPSGLFVSIVVIGRMVGSDELERMGSDCVHIRITLILFVGY
jgi:hypothetical protein